MHVKVTGEGQGHFSKGLRSPGTLMSYFVSFSDSL